MADHPAEQTTPTKSFKIYHSINCDFAVAMHGTVCLRWLGGVVVRISDSQLTVMGSNPGHSTDDYFSEVDDYLGDVTTTQVNSALHPSEVAESSTSFGWSKGRKVTSAGCELS